MRFSFDIEYNIGDKVKVLSGEHNDNWEGRIGKVVEIGIDLCQIVYRLEFRREKFKHCFKVEDLKPLFRRKNNESVREIVFNAKYEIGDKVIVLPKERILKTDLDVY